MKMSEFELLSILTAAEQDAAIYNGEFSALNTRLYKDYMQDLYGDEVTDQSQVISPDVQDVVESDMPSLARIFLGSRQPVVFEANNEQDEQEVEEKNNYVNWLIMEQPNSYQTLFAWMKEAEIQKNSVVKYYVEDERKTEETNYEGVDENELSEIYNSFTNTVEVTGQSQDENGYNITFKEMKGRQEIRIVNVPTDQFLITKNAPSIDRAELVGDKVTKTRGQLLAEGYERSLVDGLPALNEENEQKIRRDQEQGGGDSNINNWASEKVELKDLYVLVDFDGDGIAERRHILKSGNHILVNEAFDHVPYASLSCVMMPHQAIGRSRAELTQQTQRVKSVILRQTLDNMYMVNHPRNVVHPDVNIDDMLNVRPNGLVRMKKNTVVPPQGAVMPLITPYVGDKSLQVLQYLDHVRAQSTGTLMASQGLDGDAIKEETATRFSGVQEDAQAKIELVARNFAEIGFRKLYEGIAWIVKHYQDSEAEIKVLGKPMTINPSNWKHDHYVTCKVGTGAADNDKLLQNMQGVFALQSQLEQKGSPMVDQVKFYNTLAEITKGLGLKQPDPYFNNPEIEESMLQAENEILKRTVEQLQQLTQGNPLAEAETIKQQAFLTKAQSDAQLKAVELQEKVRQFDDKLEQQAKEHDQELAMKLTELETKVGEQLDKEAQSNMLVFDPDSGEFVQ